MNLLVNNGHAADPQSVGRDAQQAEEEHEEGGQLIDVVLAGHLHLVRALPLFVNKEQERNDEIEEGGEDKNIGIDLRLLCRRPCQHLNRDVQINRQKQNDDKQDFRQIPKQISETHLLNHLFEVVHKGFLGKEPSGDNGIDLLPDGVLIRVFDRNQVFDGLLVQLSSPFNDALIFLIKV